MSKTGTQIANLMTSTGKSAPDMTHALKVLGNGDMQKGFSRIGEYFKAEIRRTAAESLTKGRIQGSIISILATVTVGGIVLYTSKRKQNNSLHDAEGKRILSTMKTCTKDLPSLTDSYSTNSENQELHEAEEKTLYSSLTRT